MYSPLENVLLLLLQISQPFSIFVVLIQQDMISDVFNRSTEHLDKVLKYASSVQNVA